MSRAPAKFTQAAVSRAIRAAKREGATEVEVKPDGTLLIRLVPTSPQCTDGPVPRHPKHRQLAQVDWDDVQA